MEEGLTSKRKWTQESMRAFLERFYSVTNPDKLDTIDLILERYRGHEGELFEHLKEKYDVSEFVASSGIELPSGAQEGSGEDDDDDDDEEDGEDEHGTDVGAGPGEMPVASASGSNVGGGNATAGNTSSALDDSHQQPAVLTTSASMVQDLSNRLLGWQKSNVHQTQQNGHLSASRDPEKNQLLATVATLKSQLASVKRDNETVQRNLVSVVDREHTAARELASLSEQLRSVERANTELSAQLQTAQRLRDAKHHELEETIRLNHRLGSQVRYLACKAFETMEGATGSGGGGGGEGGGKRGELRLPEFAALDRKIMQAVDDRFGRTSTSSNSGASEAGDPTATSATTASAEAAANGSDEQPRVAALQAALEVTHSCFLASRVELRLATKQNAACEQRVAEQQMTIEGLQQRLATIERDMQTASGSADHLKRQVQETSADLASHKLMLAMAERNLALRTGELAEAREEVTALEDSLSAAAAARADLAALCTSHTAGAERRAAEHVRALTERVQCEREEALSRLAAVRRRRRQGICMLVLFGSANPSSPPHRPPSPSDLSP